MSHRDSPIKKNKELSKPMDLMNVGFVGAVGGGESGVEPDEISDMVFWHDASDSSSITKDGSNKVSQWNDKSGNAHHLTSSGGDRPEWNSGSRNSLDTVDFQGNVFMKHSAFTVEAQPLTLILVFQAPTQAQIPIDGLGSSDRIFVGTGGSNNILKIWAGTTLAGNATIAGNWSYGQAVFNGTSSSHDFTDGTNSTTASGDSGSNGSNGLTVGVLWNAASDFWNGEIAEIIMYGKEVTGDELTGLRSHLASKWGF
jgi:hypothetical protein